MTKHGKTLLDLLQGVATLPEHMRHDAVKNLADVWRQDSALVNDVVSGHTTFEKEIAPLVEETERLDIFNPTNGACNSPQFDAVAGTTKSRFAGIFPLDYVPGIPRVVFHEDLTARVGSLQVLLGLFRIPDRKKFARYLLNRAKFLDAQLQTAAA